MEKVFLGKAEKGKFIANNKYILHDYLYKLDGKNVRVVIEEATPNTRSLDQNSLYWLYLEKIAAESGDDPNSLHEVFKRKFLPPKTLKISFVGEDIRVPGSTKDLKKKDEFSEYLDRISQLTNVPIPDTVAYHKYYESAPLK